MFGVAICVYKFKSGNAVFKFQILVLFVPTVSQIMIGNYYKIVTKITVTKTFYFILEISRKGNSFSGLKVTLKRLLKLT